MNTQYYEECIKRLKGYINPSLNDFQLNSIKDLISYYEGLKKHEEEKNND